MTPAQQPKPQPKVVEHPQLDESTGFDYRTHIKDAKTGRLVRTQNYARHARNGEVLLERPPGSGNCFHENGVPAGRYRFPIKGTEVIWEKLGETHVEVKAGPANRTEELEQQNELLSLELEELRAEAATRSKQQDQKK